MRSNHDQMYKTNNFTIIMIILLLLLLLLFFKIWFLGTYKNNVLLIFYTGIKFGYNFNKKLFCSKLLFQ